jgi:hypothetical protein
MESGKKEVEESPERMEIEEIKIAESSPSAFFAHKNIVYVSNTEILKWPETLSRLGALGQDCGGSGIFRPCQYYTECNGYVIMYVEGIEKQNPSSLSSISPSAIKAYTIAVVFDSLDATELWDVCTGKESRGRGYASQILASILLFNTKSRIWLGVLFWNQHFEAVVRLYAKNGFQNPNFSNKALSGVSFPFSFLSLYWQRGANIPEQKETIESALRLREAYMGTRGGCSIRLRFENSLLKAMFKAYNDQPIEYGGRMRIFEYVDTGASYRAARVGFDPQFEVAGSKKGFQVDNPPAPINFHTHPDICYVTYGCYLGWPSSDDMAYMLTNYDQGLRLHMLISREGVYFISLSPNFVQAWSSVSDEFKKALSEAVRYFFRQIEQHRSGKNIPLEKANTTLSEFLVGVNKFSTDNALDWLRSQGIDVSGVVRNAATSVPIFQMIYLNWTDIDRTPIIEFDFHYVPLNSDNKIWPNRCDVFEKETDGQKIAYSGSEFLKLSKRGRQAPPGPP